MFLQIRFFLPVFYLSLLVASSWLNEQVSNNTLFEGDIDGVPFSTVEQSSMELNAAMQSSQYRWPNGIVPYEFNHNSPTPFQPVDREFIRSIMREFSHSTCVKFVPRSSEANFITISLQFYGTCSSNVGMQNRGSQPVWLTNHCLKRNDVLHELMHVLGFVHEHNRADRDEHVDIFLKNVEKKHHKNFQKWNLTDITHLDTEYDFTSVMHYHKFAFSSNNLSATIEPKRRGVVIAADGLSAGDVQRINRLYKCTSLNRTEPSPTTPTTITTTKLIPVDLQSVHELVAFVKSSDWTTWELISGGDRTRRFEIFYYHCHFEWQRKWYRGQISYDGQIKCKEFSNDFKKAVCRNELCSFNEPFKKLLGWLLSRKRVPAASIRKVIHEYQEFNNNDKRELYSLIKLYENN